MKLTMQFCALKLTCVTTPVLMLNVVSISQVTFKLTHTVCEVHFVAFSQLHGGN